MLNNYWGQEYHEILLRKEIAFTSLRPLPNAPAQLGVETAGAESKRLKVIKSFNSPDNSPGGLVWDGSNLWIADYTSGNIYKLDMSGNVIKSFHTPFGFPMGLAWDGSYLWAADYTWDQIIKLDTSGNVIKYFDSPENDPNGLTWDGEYLWNTDDGSKKIYKIDPSDGFVDKSFNSLGPTPGGLAWDGSYLWYTEFGCDNIYKMDSNWNLIESFNSPGDYPNRAPMGLAWDGSYLWVADANEDKIYKLDPHIIVTQYSLSTTVGSGWAGSISLDPQEDLYDAGTSVTVTAIPSSGNVFDYWSDDYLSGHKDDSQITVTMDSDKSLIANFVPIHYLSVSPDPSSGGSVSLSPSGGTYKEGTSVTVTAIPSSGNVFDYWSGDCSGSSNPISFTIYSDMNVVANFAPIEQGQYSLSVSATPFNGGTVSLSPSGGVYENGTEVTATASPSPGYEFDHWSGDVSGASSSVMVMMDSNKSINAVFMSAQPGQFTLETSVQPSDAGQIILDPSGGVYDNGTSITVTASANSGYEFDHWSGDISGTSSSSSVTMDSDKSITAHFTSTEGEEMHFVSETIPASTGGVVELGEMRVEVSENALDQDTTIEIESSEEPPQGLLGQRLKAVSRLYQIGPSGIDFSMSVTITLPYDEELLPSGVSENDLMIYRSETEGWEELGGVVNPSANTVSVKVEHFSQYAVMAKPPTHEGIPWTVVGVIILVVAGILIFTIIYRRRKTGLTRRRF